MHCTECSLSFCFQHQFILLPFSNENGRQPLHFLFMLFAIRFQRHIERSFPVLIINILNDVYGGFFMLDLHRFFAESWIKLPYPTDIRFLLSQESQRQ